MPPRPETDPLVFTSDGGPATNCKPYINSHEDEDSSIWKCLSDALKVLFSSETPAATESIAGMEGVETSMLLYGPSPVASVEEIHAEPNSRIIFCNKSQAQPYLYSDSKYACSVPLGGCGKQIQSADEKAEEGPIAYHEQVFSGNNVEMNGHKLSRLQESYSSGPSYRASDLERTCSFNSNLPSRQWPNNPSQEVRRQWGCKCKSCQEADRSNPQRSDLKRVRHNYEFVGFPSETPADTEIIAGIEGVETSMLLHGPSPAASVEEIHAKPNSKIIFCNKPQAQPYLYSDSKHACSVPLGGYGKQIQLADEKAEEGPIAYHELVFSGNNVEMNGHKFLSRLQEPYSSGPSYRASDIKRTYSFNSNLASRQWPKNPSQEIRRQWGCECKNCQEADYSNPKRNNLKRVRHYSEFVGCEKSLYNHTHLKQHVTVHNRERPYPCNMSAHPFVFKSCIQRHEGSHR